MFLALMMPTPRAGHDQQPKQSRPLNPKLNEPMESEHTTHPSSTPLMNVHEALCLLRDTRAMIKSLTQQEKIAQRALLDAIDMGELRDQRDPYEENHYSFPDKQIKLTRIVRRTFAYNPEVKRQITDLQESAKLHNEGEWGESVSLRLGELK